MPGVVGEQEFEAAVGHTFDGSWQVGTSHLARLAFVLDTDDGYLCAVTPDEAMLVEQQVPAYLSLVLLEEVEIVLDGLRTAVERSIDAVIVVAQDRHHAVGRLHLRKDVHEGQHLSTLS